MRYNLVMKHHPLFAIAALLLLLPAVARSIDLGYRFELKHDPVPQLLIHVELAGSEDGVSVLTVNEEWGGVDRAVKTLKQFSQSARRQRPSLLSAPHRTKCKCDTNREKRLRFAASSVPMITKPVRTDRTFAAQSSTAISSVPWVYWSSESRGACG